MSQDSEFKPGDKVVLRVGDRAMLVDFIQDDGNAHCVWKDDYGVLHREDFGSHLLERIDENGQKLV